MGRSSLILGITAIVIAVGFALNALLFTDFLEVQFLYTMGIAFLIGGIGAFLLQIHDEEKKKDSPENS